MRILTVFLVFFLSAPLLYGQEHVSQRDYALLEKSQACLQKEAPAEALETLRPLLARKRPLSFALSYAGLAYALLGNDAKALQTWQQAVSLYPAKKNFCYNLGMAQMGQELFAPALNSFQRVIALEGEAGGLSPAYYYLAFAYYRLGQFSSAEEAISRLTSGAAVKGHWLLLQIHCQIARQRWKAAEESGRQLVRLAPTVVSNWQLLAQIAVNRRAYPRATAYLEVAQALVSRPGNTQMLSRLYGIQHAFNEEVRVQEVGAPTLLQVEELIRSCQYSQALVRLDLLGDPPNMESSYVRARIHYALGQNSLALACLRLLPQQRYLCLLAPNSVGQLGGKALRHKKDGLRVQAFLLAGQIYWLDHHWQEARDIFKQLELLPGYGEIGGGLADCMQSLLDEEGEEFFAPQLLDPPLMVGEIR
ncbi:tetratricopeptide repeat protein [Desulfotalea psychrophila]|nr:tetratricopeptide repeat protein [Desulfotalea psychrophila]